MMVRRIGIAMFWLGLWQIMAMLVDNSILLASPVEAAGALARFGKKADFWITVGYSTLRICLGFFLAFFTGLLVGGAAYRFGGLRELLGPMIGTMKAVPVAVFAVILLIWFGSTGLTVWVSFFIVFPLVYASTIAGLASTDRDLLEMARIFRVERFKRLFFIYRPALMPHLIGCCKSALSMSWKSGVAAEVIGTPAFSIGEQLYQSKIYLDTAGIFAWTLVILAVSMIFERFFLALLKRSSKREEPLLYKKRFGRSGRSGRRVYQMGELSVSGVSYTYPQHPQQAYAKQAVLHKLNLRLSPGKIYCLMGPSGHGKTTLLRLLAGSLTPQQGRIETGDCSMVFQEDRLCEQADGIWNVCMARGVDLETAQYHLNQLLEPADYKRPVSQMSGGMRRRVALCRAVAADAPILLLDEPFNGLDAWNRQRAMQYLLREQRGRTVVITTHCKEDADLLNAALIQLA